MSAYAQPLARRLAGEGLGSCLLSAAVVGSGIMAAHLSGGNAAVTLVQIVGCCAGACTAHLMFGLPVWQLSAHIRTGPGQWLAEGVATFGLLLVVLGHRRAQDAPWMVAAWIGAAYWFTASTSFANPAITIARSLTNTFAGIRPVDVPAFIAAQLIGALAALAVARALFPAMVGDMPHQPLKTDPPGHPV